MTRGDHGVLAVYVECEGWSGGLAVDVEGQGRSGVIAVDVEAEGPGRGTYFSWFILHFNRGI